MSDPYEYTDPDGSGFVIYPWPKDDRDGATISWNHDHDGAFVSLDKLDEVVAALYVAADVPATGLTPVEWEIRDERARQVSKWGEPNHQDGTGRPGDAHLAAAFKAICKANTPDQDNFRDILAEEVFEAFAETDPAELRTELVQVAAVVVAWIETIDRRNAMRGAS